MKKYLLIIFISFSNILFGNQVVDSLKNVLNSSKNTNIKFECYGKLSEEYRSFDLDKGLYYAKLSLNEAKFQKDDIKISTAYNSIGLLNKDLGNYNDALRAHLSALEIRESLFDKNNDKNESQRLATSLSNVGEIYVEQREYELALKYFNKAILVDKKFNNLKGLSNTYNNIGIIYYYNKDYLKAIEYYKKCYEIGESLGNEKEMALALNNIGFVYEIQSKFKKALEYYNEAYIIFKKMNNLNYVSASLTNIGAVYAAQKDPKAEKKLSESLKLAIEIKSKSRQSDAYDVLVLYYSNIEDYKKAWEYQKLANQVKNKIINETKNKQIEEMTAKYESHKKDLEIKKQQEQHEQDKFQKYFLFIALVLFAGLIIFIYNRLKLTKKQKKIIELQKEIVDETNEELQQTNEEILSQRDQIEYQKELIEEKHNDIQESITYAKRIQTAILPPKNLIEKHLPNSFVYYLPKDIVAGDFYWIENIGETTFFAVADCTGHGVPGAMVSVVCNGALNRCIREYKLTKPSDILDITREIVLETFSKSEEQVKDGMDISLCVWDKKNNTLQYSGANNPLYLLKNNQIEIIKADKEPIGFNQSPTPFTNHKINLENIQMIYLFSDGYPDQFGGPKGKKLGYKKFREILFDISNSDMKNQLHTLENYLDIWMENEEQIDDVCVIGVKI